MSKSLLEVILLSLTVSVPVEVRLVDMTVRIDEVMDCGMILLCAGADIDQESFFFLDFLVTSVNA